MNALDQSLKQRRHLDITTSFGSSRRWFTIAIVLLAAVLALLIIYPVFATLAKTFVKNGSLDLTPFAAVAGARGIGSIILNTIIYTAGTVVLSAVIGSALAWSNERTDARMERLAGLFPILPLMVPPMGTAIGYVILFSDQSGALNIALRTLLGMESTTGPLPILNFPGLILVTSLTFSPMVYLLVSAALANIDPALEEASRLFGLSPLRTLAKVTLPAVVPALASSMLLVGVHTLSAFTYPFIFGTGAGITTIPVYIYRLFSAFPPSPDKAVATGMGLLTVVYVALYFQMRISHSAGRHVIGGKHSQFTVVRLGRWKWLVRTFMMLYLFAVILPVLGLVIGALQPYLGAAMAQFSLKNFVSVLSDQETTRALRNSFTLAMAAATLTVLAAALLLYSTQRVFRRGQKLTEFALMTPSAIPTIILAVAFIVSFSGPPFYLFGTKLLVVLAYCVIFIPDATRAASSAISQASEQLSEAAHVCGAGMLYTLRKVVLPQTANGLLAGWLIVFLLAVNEVTMSTFLGGLNSTVVGQVSINYFSNGRVGEVAALSLIVTIVTMLVVFAAGRLVRGAYRNVVR